MKVKFLFLLLILAPFIFSQDTTEAADTTEENKEVLSQEDYKINPVDSESSEDDSTTIPGVNTGDYFRVVFILVVVIVLLYAVLQVIKKVGGNRVGLDNDQIKVLSTKVLKGTTALHLVEVGSQVFLIGATDSSINGISEITDKETLDTLKLEATQEEGFTNSFLGLFTKNLNKNSDNVEATTESLQNVQINKGKLDKY